MRLLPALALAASLALPLSLPALAQQSSAGTLTVSGEGVVRAVPDQAVLMIGVTTQAETAAAALAANSAALSSVLAQLTAAGIAERDMQTSNLSINPNWSNYDGSSESKITSYIATNQLEVRIRALDTLGAVVDAAISDGANTLNGLTFGVSDPKPMMNEARKAAVADARARAEVLAGAVGAKLGRIVSISDGGNYAGPAPMFRADAAAGAPPVQGGEVGLTATVTMTYEIAE